MGGEILLSLNISLISLMALTLLSKEHTEEHCLLAVLLRQLSLCFLTLQAARPSPSHTQRFTRTTGHALAMWHQALMKQRDHREPGLQITEAPRKKRVLSYEAISSALFAVSSSPGHFPPFVLGAVSA